jgi:hypothetical protein
MTSQTGPATQTVIDRINIVLRETIPFSLTRRRRLKQIKWVVRLDSYELEDGSPAYAGLDGIHGAFQSKAGAVVYDGRDAVETKLKFYSALLGCEAVAELL